MDVRRFIRSVQRQAGIGGPGLVDLLAPAIGILAIGLAAGASVAFLFAPSSGEKLREQIQSKLTGARSKLLAQGENLGIRPQNTAASLGHQS
jgi:hypothetical protein